MILPGRTLKVADDRTISLPFTSHSLSKFPDTLQVNFLSIFSRVHETLYPALSVHQSVGPSVTLLFRHLFGLLPHCSFQNALATSNTAPAHPHATEVATYPTSFHSSHSLQSITFLFVYYISIRLTNLFNNFIISQFYVFLFLLF